MESNRHLAHDELRLLHYLYSAHSMTYYTWEGPWNEYMDKYELMEDDTQEQGEGMETLAATSKNKLLVQNVSSAEGNIK